MSLVETADIAVRGMLELLERLGGCSAVAPYVGRAAKLNSIYPMLPSRGGKWCLLLSSIRMWRNKTSSVMRARDSWHCLRVFTEFQLKSRNFSIPPGFLVACFKVATWYSVPWLLICKQSLWHSIPVDFVGIRSGCLTDREGTLPALRI